LRGGLVGLLCLGWRGEEAGEVGGLGRISAVHCFSEPDYSLARAVKRPFGEGGGRYARLMQS
jgi:hypothetical protein